ncbi:helix-turn-helix transcriptional regulator [Corallococcus interemptor]|uniref:helix-turn-helix transcriptional regulator n=1 Tax=Corallococcus TaxID=83461 RepID=UPI001CBAA288|nr:MULTISPECIES: helix-turn-helix transcriptional regulator [unclassified Corallococcus]MBZ4334841.1 helix-turn-helix transcriptional regulator [Corallococcus sp. AS-1-12]MBZ4376928.1 helix-turn-helix transcriptional regulator [Corallococcus sp. AS-1-6]
MGKARKFLSREQALVAELKEALGDARTLEDVYEALSRALLSLCEADHLAVGCANPDGTAGLQWRTDTVHPLLKDYAEWVQEDFVFRATVVQPNLVLSDAQMLRGQPLVETETFRRSQGAGLKLKRVLASLLFTEQDLKGGIAMYRESSRPFTLKAQWFLQQIIPYISRAVARLQELYAVRFERDLLKAIAMGASPVLVLNSLGRKVVDTGPAIPLLERWFPSHELSDGVPRAWAERVRALSRFDVAADPRLESLTLERDADRLDVTFSPSAVNWGSRNLWQVRMHERVHWLRPDWKEKLTAQESRVADCLHEGLANKEISARLGCSVETVKVHIKSLFDKTGIHSRGEFVAKGRRA